jgi:hypothetical protein
MECSAANHQPVVEELGEQFAAVQRYCGLGRLGVVLGGKPIEVFDIDPESGPARRVTRPASLVSHPGPRACRSR